VSTARQDRQQQFDALYAAHHATLHAYFLGKTSDAELALDLLQDAFVRAWRNLTSLEGLSPERQRMWLFAVARNLVVDHYRSAATRRSTDAAMVQAAASAQTTSPPADVDVLTRERLGTLDHAIHQLPEDLRVVLVLQAVGERNSTEIGELLGRPPGTVRYQLAEARRRLARQLQLDAEHDT
jgi:RNA polymerase sigma-70 factor (ECF subfamily)